MTPSLQKRLSIILGLLLTISGITSFIILKVVIAPAFSTLEGNAASTDLGRAMLAVDSQSQQLKAVTGDWAPWDESWSFGMGTNADFVERNVDLRTLQNLDLDVVVFYGPDKRRIWSVFLSDGQHAEFSGLGRFESGDPALGPMLDHAGPDSVVSGLLMTSRGPLLVSSMPLRRTGGEGPTGGTIVMGRMLDQQRLQDIRQHIKVSFDIVPMSDAIRLLPDVVEQVLRAPENRAVQTVGEAVVLSHRLLRDITGEPLGIMRTETTREVTSLGQNAADIALLLFVVTAVAIIASIWILLWLDIVRPLERLAAHMTGIRRSGDLTARIASGRGDEIGRLGKEFNDLAGALHEARLQLSEQSFKAGRADTAAEVLHNIRNAMTPVVDVAENLSATLEDVAALHLEQAARELSGSDCDARRREGLLRYLVAASSRIREAVSEASDDVNLVYRQTRLVEDIVAAQEKVSRAPPVQEDVILGGVVTEAAAILPRQSGLEVGLDIGPEVSDLPVRGNRVQLLQVVGNIVLNAYEAIGRSGRNGGTIRISARTADEAGSAMVELSISDDGAGLDEATRTQIFQRGFSSKGKAGSGLGLHWTANTVRAMGGSIRVESAGPGRGATAYVLLPAAADRSAAEGRRAAR